MMKVGREETLRSVAWKMPRDRKNILLNWVNRRGPFIESDRQDVGDDLFYFDDIEVTDLGLGEAARRIVKENRAAVLSTTSATTSLFARTPLRVIHGFCEEPINRVDVPNFMDGARLEKKLKDAISEPRNWNEFLAQCETRFDRVLIGAHCRTVLKSHPFQPSVGRMAFKLLSILQKLMGEMDESGTLTPRGNNLFVEHFVGKNAWFTDESKRRKDAAPDRFTFPDPTGEGDIDCFWHGKIKTRFYRIHFEWPVRPPRRYLKVGYIGPHL